MTQEPTLVPIEDENPEKPIQGIDDKKSLATVPKNVKMQLSVTKKMTDEQIMAIRSRTPGQFIKKFQGRGGKELSYIPVALYVRKLNFVFGYGAWSFEIVKSEVLEGQAVVQGLLIVPDLNMRIAQFGGHPVARSRDTKEAVDIGDTFKAAASDCLKKCCSMIGMFADLYSPSDFVDVQVTAEPEAAETEMQNLKRIIDKSDAKGIKKALAGVKASKKYSKAQKKTIIEWMDKRMSTLPDGSPVK